MQNYSRPAFNRLYRRTRAVAVCMLALAAFASCRDVGTTDTVKPGGELVVVTRNGPTTYYNSRYGPEGFEYALARNFAADLGMTLKIREVDSLKQMFRELDSGRAQLAAAGLTVTTTRASKYAVSPSYMEVRQLVIYRTGEKRPRKPEDLVGSKLMVIAGSSHAERLRQLRKKTPALRWRQTADLSITDLLDMLSSGDIDYAIVDSNAFAINKSYYPQLRKAFAISDPQPLAWFMPKSGENDLKKAAGRYFERIRENGKLAALVERYYGHTGHINQIGARAFAIKMENRLPKWESLIHKVAGNVGMDWRLLAAMSYQESHWNPHAKSPTGVRGMMMLTQTTAAEIGVNNRLDPHQSLLGGARYFRIIRERLPNSIREPDRTWMALAAYNVGMSHLEDARVMTQKQGGDPNRWVDVMERLPLLQNRRYYKHTRFGYARGSESVAYVQHIRYFYNVLAWNDVVASRKPPPANAKSYLPAKLQAPLSLAAL